MKITKEEKQIIIEEAIRLINESKLSGYKISKDTGITEVSISQYKKGARPSYTTAKVIVEYFNNQSQNISGSGNAASYHGHAALIQTPANMSSKIINDDGIEITCDPVPDQKTQQRMKELENEVLILRAEAKHKSELIAKLSDEIEFLRGVINR